MRRVSLKRARLNRAVKPSRDAYKREHPLCQWCQLECARELHEIARGASRAAALSERAAILHLCRPCHDVMGWLPVEAQLAVKKIADPAGYNRQTVNVLRGRQRDAITEQEVDRWVARLMLGATV